MTPSPIHAVLSATEAFAAEVDAGTADVPRLDALLARRAQQFADFPTPDEADDAFRAAVARLRDLDARIAHWAHEVQRELAKELARLRRQRTDAAPTGRLLHESA